MAFIDGYKGTTAPAVSISFKGDTVPGSKARTIDRNFDYWIKNKNLFKFVITGLAAGKTYVWTREATAANPYWNESLQEYTLPPVDVDDINALVDNPGTAWKIELQFSYKLFLDNLLYYFTKLEHNDFSNFAAPAAPVDKNAILSSLVYTRQNNRVTATFNTVSARYDNVPMKLADKSARKGARGVPAVKLMFELDLVTSLDQTKKDLMRKLMAADYTRLLGTGRGTLKPLEQIWRDNVVTYLMTHVNPGRGQSLMNHITQMCLNHAGDRAGFTAVLRGAIDDRMITANHWGQRREDWNTEQYQSICSDIFGTILETSPWASPVKLLREIEDRLMPVDRQIKACYQLQFGTGHCGEHSNLAFILLGSMASQANIHHIVATGNANIDHAFTIYDLPVTAVNNVVAHNPNNGSHKPGGPQSALQVFDLRKSVMDNIAAHASSGWVVDAYLDPSEQPMTGEGLLLRLNSQQRVQEGRDTDFLEYNDYFSNPSAPPTVSNTPSQVKNV